MGTENGLESLIHFVANTTRRVLQTGATNQRNTGAGMIDLEDLKTRLAEYDPAAPKCPLQITRHRTNLDFYEDYDMTTYVPCCRPEGHEGECRNARPVMGWPDFQTISQLVAEVERLRLDRDDIEHAYSFARDKAKLLERQAVVAYLRGSNDNRVLDYADSIEHGEHRKED